MLSLTSLKTAVLGGLLSEVGACRVGGCLLGQCWVGWWLENLEIMLISAEVKVELGKKL